MSLITETGYLMKDIKEELKTKINSHQLYFVFSYLILLVMFSFYTYIIIKTKSTLIILISMIILFTYTAYQCHFANRVMKLCDVTLKKWRKTINQTKEMIEKHKELLELMESGLHNLRGRLNKRLQKKKHRS